LAAHSEKLHVAGVGRALSEAYESLRNAAENSAESLQLTRAIRRFFHRNLMTSGGQSLMPSGEDLIAELTLAGYIDNDSVPIYEIQHISELVKNYTHCRNVLKGGFDRKTLDRWTLEPLAAEVEAILRDHSDALALGDFAYQYFLSALDFDKIFSESNSDKNRGKGETTASNSQAKPAGVEVALLVAVEMELLGFDAAAARLNLLLRYQTPPTRPPAFAKLNQQIDQIFSSKMLDKLRRIVDRHSAPLRILRQSMRSDANFAQRLSNSTSFLALFSEAIEQTYAQTQKSVNRGIVRSVIFLIITKFLIGIAAEVPYDLWTNGAVRWLALGVNLAVPPIYMILLRLTLMMPGQNNSRALSGEIEHILYDARPALIKIRGKASRSFGAGYNLAYSLVILIVFGGVGWILVSAAHFEWIHLLIFYVFISAASFLGFRLSRLIRQIEIVAGADNGVTLVRDFLYMPFVAVGRRISETYSKINIVSRILDVLIELPLKTILRTLRRWTAFIGAKKDEL
jgi:hypothetical protein